MAENERATDIIEAHQELVASIERSTSRIRILSAVTIVVAVVLAFSYLFELSLPLTGVTTVTVNLADPANQAAEIIVLGLSLVWLYVGATNLLFSSRIKGRIADARTKEREIGAHLAGAPSSE